MLCLHGGNAGMPVSFGYAPGQLWREQRQLVRHMLYNMSDNTVRIETEARKLRAAYIRSFFRRKTRR